MRGGGRGGPPVRGGGRGGNTGTTSYGAKSFGGAAFDRQIWVQLVQHLRKIDLLPVVVFTFSKKRCEENAGTLSSQDLCVASEKSEIHVVIEKALTRLKGKYTAGFVSLMPDVFYLSLPTTRLCHRLG